MSTATRLGGVKLNVKSGAYSLALQANGIFAANLSSALKSIPKHVLGALASEVLVGAVETTFQDSSRAAANWDLSFSGLGSRENLSPEAYGETGKSWGAIGSRFDAGAYRDAVLAAKKMYYGIGVAAGGSWNQAIPGGRLHDTLGIGKPGTSPRVDLFNPIMGTRHQRRAGDREQGLGATYAYYAFEGATPDTWVQGLQSKRMVVGNGFIPWLIMDLNKAVQKATAAKQIIKL